MKYIIHAEVLAKTWKKYAQKKSKNEYKQLDLKRKNDI